jgi:hypothetical protein
MPMFREGHAATTFEESGESHHLLNNVTTQKTWIFIVVKTEISQDNGEQLSARLTRRDIFTKEKQLIHCVQTIQMTSFQP